MANLLNFLDTPIMIYPKPEGNDAEASISSIRLISNEKEPVASENNSFKNGDVVFLKGSSYSIVNGLHVVKPVSDSEFKLVGRDFSSLPEINDAEMIIPKAILGCFAKSLSVKPVVLSKTDVTTNCDPFPKSATTKEAGTIDIDFFWNPEEPIIKFLRKEIDKQNEFVFQFLPKGTKTIISYIAKVADFEYSATVKEYWQGKVQLTIVSDEFTVQVSS